MIRTSPFHERTSALNETGLWEPLVRTPRRATATRCRTSSSTSRSATRRDLRLVAALQVPDPRPDAERSWPASWPATSGPARPGNAQYTAWCDDRGFVVEDGVILRPGRRRVPADLRRAQPRLLRGPHRARLDVAIEEVSRRPGRPGRPGSALARPGRAAGPRRRDDPLLRRSPTAKIAGSPVTVSRTGYSGDLGFEMWIHSADALKVWDALWDVSRGSRRAAVRPDRPVHAPHRGRPAAPRRRLRTQPLRLDRRGPVDPDRARLGWMVRDLATDDRAFIGRDAIERELADRTSRWRLTGLVVDWRRLRPDLRRGRADPAQGPHADPGRVFHLRRRHRPGRLRHELHVLPDAPAPHRPGPRAARPLARRDRRVRAGDGREPPLRVRPTRT